ncbi:MAG: helix-turn-helix domain-containing protein [Candidatus Pacebacteria bacterium]|nr:helix-turn-helix domain-containing protein [Candidatus Paceibacterota bacterium]
MPKTEAGSRIFTPDQQTAMKTYTQALRKSLPPDLLKAAASIVATELLHPETATVVAMGGSPLTEAQRAKIIELARTNLPMTARQIAAELGVHVNTVYNVLKPLDLTGPRGRPPALSEEQVKKVIALYLEGLSMYQIACGLKVSSETIRNILHERGVNVRHGADAQQGSKARGG